MCCEKEGTLGSIRSSVGRPASTVVGQLTAVPLNGMPIATPKLSGAKDPARRPSRVAIECTIGAEGKSMPNIVAIAGPNSKYALPNSQPAGFLAGLWHGAIAPVTFFVSLFQPSVRIYETNNCGRLYDLGFMVAITVHGNGRLWIRTTFGCA
jgi:hypothetical protein